MLDFEWFSRSAGVRGTRQKGLVDHICPARFSYLVPKRKEPLTILT
jgi:hypothetical protein